MLKLEAASKAYSLRGRDVVALERATLDIEDADFVSVVGPSGSGKSTLLLVLGGMLSPSEGRVVLDGTSIYDLSSDARAELRQRKVGFLFQSFNLLPYLSALENVRGPLLLAGADEAAQVEKATALLERVGLTDRLEHKPFELSVGQQQRVALARMLANEPDLVLADEPTGNLDPETTEQVMAFLEEINDEGRAVVMVTHDPKVAARARRTVELRSGVVSEIVAQG